MRTILGWIATLVLCPLVFGTFADAQQRPPPGCPPVCPMPEWYTYRHDNSRTGVQPYASALSDPAKVANLSVEWQFPATGPPAGAFSASPIVVNDRVFIGSTNGYFYALDAATGALKWQFPKVFVEPLLGTCNYYGRYGIQSSATYARIGGREAVIFGAPDPSAEGGLGSARLFALTLSGDLIWQSGIIAHVNGCHRGNFSERHERIGYSSPLVLGNKVYVGVHDWADDPIQQGRVSVVDLASGKLVPFSYASTGTLGDGTHGGGVWNALATDGTGVYFTTGNTRIPACPYPYTEDKAHCICITKPSSTCPPPAYPPEPSPNHGLSMIRVDKDTGNIVWAVQPVPFKFDGDPDWAAGATVMSTSCGGLIASVQKDGWSYAFNAGNGSVRWQFPPTEVPFTSNAYIHGDDDYRRPGAAWNDVFIVRTGGESLVHDGVSAGYSRLHALNACAAAEKDRVRWIADFPQFSREGSLGAPTVTGGIVFIGTDQNPNPNDLKAHLVVLGDPSVVPPVGSRCSNIDYTTPSACMAAGYALVPTPKVLANVAMPDGGSLVAIRNEPALAKGRVFVGTNNGHIYMLDTLNPPPPPECRHCGTPKQCCICNGGTWINGRCT